MTKDVELHSSTWKTMKQAITGLTGNSTISRVAMGITPMLKQGPIVQEQLQPDLPSE